MKTPTNGSEVPAPPMTPLELLFRSLTTASQRIAVGDLNASLIEVRRASKKRPPDARITINDEMAKALRGAEEDRPIFLLVGIPRDLAVKVDQMRTEETKQAERRIVTPQEARGRIVR